jgi:hypothetical protein
MPTERQRRRSAGQASIEAVLVMPLLLTLVILAENSARIMLFKEQAIISTRLAAWREARFGGTEGFGRCRATRPARSFGGSFAISGCPTADADATRFLKDMDRSGNSESRGANRDVSGDPRPQVVTVDGSGGYWPFGPERFARVELEDHHTLSANRAWEREDLPIGYDRFLKRKLDDGRKLFPNLFPRAR